MKLAISAAFTAEPLERVVHFWSSELGVPIEVEFAPFNQLSQTLLDPASVFARNSSGGNILLLRADDLLAEDPVSHAKELVSQIHSSASQRSVPLIVGITPASPDSPHNISEILNQFRSGLSETPGITFIEPHEFQIKYPVSDWYSEQGDRIGKLPYTESFYAALGSVLVRRSIALRRPPYKVIVLDCDNTLWQGVCGEDGPTGIRVEPERAAMQEFFKQRKSEGMLLAIASKNNPDDVAETFRLNPQMPLKLDDFTAVRINWSPKSENLRSLADELNLGLDSFIFIDDDAKECAEVQEVLPEVLTIPLPHDVDTLPHFIQNVWAFDTGTITDADRKRSESYKAVRDFSTALQSSESHESFMASLNLNVKIQPLDAAHLARAAQLTQRTNQFNATTIRRTESEILALVDSGATCWTVDVSDRFGQYGQTGTIIFQKAGEDLEVDTLLLSCRVLGRGVEHHVMKKLAEEAARRNLPTVFVPFTQTPKNNPVESFLKQVATHCEVGEESPFRFPAEKLKTLSWKPQSLPATPTPAKTKKENTVSALPYLRIARTLTTAEQIVAALRGATGFNQQHHTGMTETERRLAQIWSEILQIPSVAPQDNFFDLGGHSLLVVLLQMRVREIFDIELEVDDVYSGTLTLQGLAEKIEIKKIGELTPQEYRALVAEIDALTEQEVHEFLAREGHTQ